MNTWPGKHRHAITQSEHEAWNASSFPGTRQLCATCDAPTERCEDDAIYTEEGEGPLCVECWHKTPEYILENDSDQGQSVAATLESDCSETQAR